MRLAGRYEGGVGQAAGRDKPRGDRLLFHGYRQGEARWVRSFSWERGRGTLDEAQVVLYAGSLINTALLDGLRAECHDSAGMDLDEIVEVLEKAALEGKRVVRLHSGDVSFYSAITEQIHRLGERGIEVEVVPGVSSLAAGAAALGQELTVPEVSQTVIVTRRAGRTPVPEKEAIELLASHRATMVVFLSVGMMEELAGELIEGGYPAGTPAAVIERASWPGERVIRGTLQDIAGKVREAGITRTALIYVGESLRASLEAPGKTSRLYHRDFRHGSRP
ncbi:MAG: precorrin-4 C(11)-methyltransferase [Nitrospirota bacterium]